MNSGKSKNTGLKQYWASIRALLNCLPSELGGLPRTLFPTNVKVGQRCLLPTDLQLHRRHNCIGTMLDVVYGLAIATKQL